jgi:hypothetical protein
VRLVAAGPLFRRGEKAAESAGDAHSKVRAAGSGGRRAVPFRDLAAESSTNAHGSRTRSVIAGSGRYLPVGHLRGIARTRQHRLGTPLARALPSGFGVPHECPEPEKARMREPGGRSPLYPFASDQAWIVQLRSRPSRRCAVSDRARVSSPSGRCQRPGAQHGLRGSSQVPSALECKLRYPLSAGSPSRR